MTGAGDHASRQVATTGAVMVLQAVDLVRWGTPSEEEASTTFGRAAAEGSNAAGILERGRKHRHQWRRAP